MKSNPSGDALPRDFADAIERAGPRLGRLASRIVFLASTGSTNDVASGLAASAEHEGAVVIADAQTAGRGRRGHSWLSPPGSGLYVSVVLAPARAAFAGDRATALLTLAAGVALAEGLEAATGIARRSSSGRTICYVARRKVGGHPGRGRRPMPWWSVTVSTSARRRFHPSWPDVPHRSRANWGARSTARTLFAETLAALARRYDDLLAGRFDAILDEWRARAPGERGARVSWATPSGTQNGVTAGIDDRGALLVNVDGRTERIVAGELTWD